MIYEPTWESVTSHPVPGWFEGAKLGVFIHWGLYSVPGWAPRVPDIQAILRHHSPRWLMRNNPYAEWYANTVQLDGSPTQRHHAEAYGRDTPYEDFVEPFERGSSRADLVGLAELCRRAGARYVVLTTKHHEGFCLWPTSIPHPAKGAYHVGRDLVGELADALRAQELRMGLYYSGGYDWSFNGAVIRGAADAILAPPAGRAYARYADAHVRELVDRYHPSIVWNDIGWPADGDLAGLFAFYYNAVADGVVNDRWIQPSLPRGAPWDALVRAAGGLVESVWAMIPERHKRLRVGGGRHFDFSTPEYEQFASIVDRKWEATRGLGHSFGANRNEDLDDVLSTTELVRSFIDIVSKNGNLLIGVGPTADGSVPDWQQAPLLGLGRWLEANGEAIFDSRPWETPSTTTSEGTDVRFTRGGDAVYAMLLDTPGVADFELRGVEAAEVRDVSLLGIDGGVNWSVKGDVLTLTLAGRLPVAPARTLRLFPSSSVRFRG
jgi:alpha-L-fucosidase